MLSFGLVNAVCDDLYQKVTHYEVNVDTNFYTASVELNAFILS